MDEVLAATLQDAVHERLDYLDTLVAEADLPSRAALAELEIARLIAAWRAVLAKHQPDDDNRCPQCSGWRRRRKFPCSVWITAHSHLVSADGPLSAGFGRHTRVGDCSSIAAAAS